MIRKNIFIILTVSAMIGFFSNTVLSAQYRIGVPKNHVAAPYKWFFNSLAGKNPAIAKDLTIVEIDLEGYRDSAGREKIRRDIAEKCDLFFSTGDDLNIIFEVGITSPLLFFSISDLTASIPESMRKNTTGIYRESKAELFKQLMQILPEDQRKRIGMIYCRGGKLEKLMFNFMQLSEKMGVELITKSFSDSSDIGRVMQEFKQEKATAVMLLPPALCSEQDLIEIIAWQKKLSLPVIGQIKEQIKQGILGGPAMDSKQIGPNLADYATKILRGRNPHQLPIKFFGAKYVVNLNTASQLGTIIPQAIIEHAEIVGMANHNKVIEKNNISPVAGNFTIGVPATLPAPLLKSLLQALEDRGYFLENNLRLVRFEISKDSSAAQLEKLGQELSAKTDLIFTNGTSLILLKKIQTISSPICFISTQELITDIPPSLKKNFTGVIRASVLSLMDMIQQMMPGKQRITVMSHSATNLPETESEYRNAAKQYNLILDFRYFADEKQVGETMREIAGQSDFILLYPPGITNHDVTEIVKWQNQLKLPVLSQLKSHIKAGLLGGPTTDLDKTSPKLAEYIDKILQGREPAQLPYFYYQTKYVINLQTASTLKQDIPVDITTNAEIIF